MKPYLTLLAAVMGGEIVTAQSRFQVSSANQVVSASLPSGWHLRAKSELQADALAKDGFDLAVLTRFDPHLLTNALALPANGAIITLVLGNRKAPELVRKVEDGGKSARTAKVVLSGCRAPAVCEFSQVDREEAWPIESNRRSVWRIFQCGSSFVELMFLYDASNAEAGMARLEFEVLFDSIRCEPKPSQGDGHRKP